MYTEHMVPHYVRLLASDWGHTDITRRTYSGVPLMNYVLYIFYIMKARGEVEHSRNVINLKWKSKGG